MSGTPVGALDAAKGVDGGIEVAGWAIDPDTADPIAVHLYVDSIGTAVLADRARPDLPAHYPDYGPNHGYSTKLPATPGAHRVCAYAINAGPGGTATLGCADVTVPASTDLGRPPIGAFDALTVKENIATASGWALDPDSTGSIGVHLYVGDKGTAYTADESRADVAQAYPGYGPDHGFAEQLTLPLGSTQVCAYAINTGAGGHTLLGCRTATVTAPPPPDGGKVPLGNFEAALVGGGGATVTGWALDPDTADPISIHVYVDSEGTAYVADESRPDVGAAYPSAGDGHGFSEFVPMTAGAHSVCVYAINNGAGGHVLLGCRDLLVP